jgi:hypothetical protein
MRHGAAESKSPVGEVGPRVGGIPRATNSLSGFWLPGKGACGGERGLDGRQFQSHCCAVRQRSIARFLAEILGLPFPKQWGPFLIVTTNNGTNLDFMNADGQVAPQHYAFLVSEAEFDEVFGRVRERSLPYWADPAQKNQVRSTIATSSSWTINMIGERAGVKQIS